MILTGVVFGGLIFGVLIPKRWGVLGFLAAGLFLFAVQVGANTATGFAGSSIEESLLLFNDSWAAYIGFNIQVTYRAFAPVLLALSLPFIYRLQSQSR